MSDYSVQINWSGKDSLPDSSADKIISGADFQTEFDAIEVASATKADVNGSATEAFSCSTPASGSDTTVAATTEWVNDAIDAIPSSYPVGSIFLTVTDYADSDAVVAAIGGTTWERFAEGKMVIGYSTTDSDFGTVEDTGGAKTHTLTTDEMPSHSHDIYALTARQDTWNEKLNTSTAKVPGEDTGSGTFYGGKIGNTGGGDAHDIMNPYIVTYMWKRTA